MVAATSSGLPTSAALIVSRPDLTFGFSHNIGVSTAPGRMALTRMPLGLPSMEAERVNDSSAALAAAYEATCGRSEERRVGKECRSRWLSDRETSRSGQ